MAQTPYTPVSWTKEPVSKAKLQQMADNDQWLFENTPRMTFIGPGVRKADGLKIAAGRSWYAARAESWNSVTVNFGNFFTVGCMPSIVTTVNPLGGSWHFMYSAIGSVDGAGEPDYRGFTGYIMCDAGHIPNDKMMGTGGWLMWQAIGY